VDVQNGNGVKNDNLPKDLRKFRKIFVVQTIEFNE